VERLRGASQVPAVAPGGVRFVAAEMVGPRTRVCATEATDTDALHDRDELRSVAPLARSDQQGQGTASTLTGEVNLAGQDAPGASESLVGAVLPGRASFSWDSWRFPTS
jgi:hypothetical protein